MAAPSWTETMEKNTSAVGGTLREPSEMRAVAAVLLVTIAAAGASLYGGRDEA